MERIALLIGVSEYESGLNPLPGAVKDVEAMQQVLQRPDMGGFDTVKVLTNPDLEAMQKAIETLFSERSKEDLVLLFFSGHGIKDDNGKLYLTTRGTCKTTRGDLVRSTAVPASFVQEIMSSSNCKQQVVILDCCFSGAFANGMAAKDDGIVDVQAQLSGEGRAVLTSSTATQYSFFEQQNSDLSIYTRYIVEGIETGAADLDGDGWISAVELHDYAQKKVQASTPAMKPKIYPVGEGFRIIVASAPACDAKLIYRREAERLVGQGEISNDGEFSYLGRSVLDALQEVYGLHAEEAETIEADVLKPYQEYRRKLQRYQEVFIHVVANHSEIPGTTRNTLMRLQHVLNLRSEDVNPIESEILQQYCDQTLDSTPQVAESVAPIPAVVVLSPLTKGVEVSKPTSGKLPPKVIAGAAKNSDTPRSHRQLNPIRFTLLTTGTAILLATTGIYFRLHNLLPLSPALNITLDQVSEDLNTVASKFQSH